VDVADATETAQVVAAIADRPGPVYLRLKRGEIPVIFPEDHRLSLDHAQVLVSGCDRTRRAAGTAGGGVTTGGGVARGGTSGGGVSTGGAQTEGGAETAGGAVSDGGAVSTGGGVTRGGAETSGRGGTGGGTRSVADVEGQVRAPEAIPGSDVVLLVSGMMVAPALAAARVLRSAGIATVVLNVPVIKPLDAATVLAAAAATQTVITAENHSTIGGLGSAVAEVLAEAALPRPLHRLGLNDTYAEGARTPHYLFRKYGLSTQHVVDAAWSALHQPGSPPRSTSPPAAEGEYAPV
jgi:transketolase